MGSGRGSPENRDAIYRYLATVFEMVAWWDLEGKAVKRAHRALRLRAHNSVREQEPFAALILCTSDPGKVDDRTRSKWSRVLRYAAEFNAGKNLWQRLSSAKVASINAQNVLPDALDERALQGNKTNRMLDYGPRRVTECRVSKQGRSSVHAVFGNRGVANLVIFRPYLGIKRFRGQARIGAGRVEFRGPSCRQIALVDDDHNILTSVSIALEVEGGHQSRPTKMASLHSMV